MPADDKKTTQVNATRVNQQPSPSTALAPAEANVLYEGYATLDPTWQQPKAVSDDNVRLMVAYAASVGATPAVLFNWTVQGGYFNRGYRVDFFLSTEGFARLTDNTPLDQLQHGKCIHSATGDGDFTATVGEGQSFFTALLVSKKPTGLIGRYIGEKRKQWLGSYVHTAAMVQFTVNVPSLKTGLSRIIDQNRLTAEVRQNVTARVELAALAGELDLNWHSNRYANDVSRQVTERLVAWTAIERVFRERRAQIENDSTLSATERLRCLRELEDIRQSELRLRQFAVRDPK